MLSPALSGQQRTESTLPTTSLSALSSGRAGCRRGGQARRTARAADRRQDNAGMRLVCAVKRWRSTVRRSTDCSYGRPEEGSFGNAAYVGTAYNEDDATRLTQSLPSDLTINPPFRVVRTSVRFLRRVKAETESERRLVARATRLFTPEHDPLYGAGVGSVQGLLARLASCQRENRCACRSRLSHW
jgi:hypothetical protein